MNTDSKEHARALLKELVRLVKRSRRETHWFYAPCSEWVMQENLDKAKKLIVLIEEEIK